MMMMMNMSKSRIDRLSRPPIAVAASEAT